ncbi:hypothetical protein [Staphylococcus hominis]|uniref:hypothetical protein n=1 Tax=Staphylococcus hominis TaxID=1290 RepID=UPI002DD64498|nr:hypothetical protein [Staphylococcus hominis]WRY66802.1 hypothetical protein P8632_05860 [Staphylococcus hominis]
MEAYKKAVNIVDSFLTEELENSSSNYKTSSKLLKSLVEDEGLTDKQKFETLTELKNLILRVETRLLVNSSWRSYV